jgi:sigma-E factor negative regulatory protein RseA
MTDQIREQISALLDGELAKDELGLLVRRMERDADLRRAFGNYVLIGEALRAPGSITASRGFAARVEAALDVAPPARVEAADPLQRQRQWRWAKPAIASAVAASVAVAGVLLLRLDSRVDEPVADATDRVESATFVDVPQSSAASPTLEQSQRLAGYLVAHSQFSSPLGRRAVLMNVLAEDPGLERVSYQTSEAP